MIKKNTQLNNKALWKCVAPLQLWLKVALLAIDQLDLRQVGSVFHTDYLNIW